MRLALVLLLVLVVGSPRADAQPTDTTIFAGESPGDTAQLPQPGEGDKPNVESGWLSWLVDWVDWIWSWFEVAWEVCVEAPVEWVRNLFKGWFCWLMMAALNLLWDVLDLDRWPVDEGFETRRQLIGHLESVSGFLGRIFPFHLWAICCGVYLSAESLTAVVRWIIGLIPGT